MSTGEIYYRNLMRISRQLEEIGFPCESAVAEEINKVHREKEQLSNDEIRTALCIKMISDYNSEDMIDPYHCSYAILRGTTRLFDICKFLKNVGLNKNEVKIAFKRNSQLLMYDLEYLRDSYEILKNYGLNEFQIKEVFVDAVCVGKDECELRCACVRKYFPKEMLYMLAKKWLFYRYYTDPADCIEYLVTELGKGKATELLTNEEGILYLWKEKHQRSDTAHGIQHNEALETIEKYRDEALEKQIIERMKVNTPKENIELGKRYNTSSPERNKKLVVFKNGTCVVVHAKNGASDEEIKKDAEGKLRVSRNFDVEINRADNEPNDSTKGILHKMTNVFGLVNLHYWSDEKNSNVDEMIVRRYYYADVRDLEVEMIVF